MSRTLLRHSVVLVSKTCIPASREAREGLIGSMDGWCCGACKVSPQVRETFRVYSGTRGEASYGGVDGGSKQWVSVVESNSELNSWCSRNRRVRVLVLSVATSQYAVESIVNMPYYV